MRIIKNDNQGLNLASQTQRGEEMGSIQEKERE
jgi:hypothetical protein